MRDVAISTVANQKLLELRNYLHYDLQLSQTAVDRRWSRILTFLNSLGNDADYALCRFEKWRELGYRCVPFERDWVFAYEIVPEGVLIQDMGNASAMKK